MIYLVAALMAVSVGSAVFAVGARSSGQSRVARQRLATIQAGHLDREADERRRRREHRESLQTLLETLGERFSREGERARGMDAQLLKAGYRHPNRLGVYMAVRLVLAGGAALGGAFLGSVLQVGGVGGLLLTVTGGLLGWMLPFLHLKRRGRRRTRNIQRGLPDAIDLMVVCVEAGYGLNQALVRVADESERLCPEVSDELTLTTLEMRAGTSRTDALRNLAQRTDLKDVRSWVGMLIQTDRFGTSVADALRVHADDMRTERRQRAEEAAAKLTVKMLIPLVLFVFPALFVVVLGPALLTVLEFFG